MSIKKPDNLQEEDVEYDYSVWFIHDNLGDIKLMEEAIKEAKSEFIELHEKEIELRVINDGEKACEIVDFVDDGFTSVSKPNVIFLYTNISKVHSDDVLKVIKSRFAFSAVPVVVFTVASSEQILEQYYDLGANSYVLMPTNYEEFISLCKRMFRYWLFDNVVL